MPPYLNFKSLNKLLNCIVNIYACVLYVCIDCLLLCHSCCMARVVFVNKVCSVLFCSGGLHFLVCKFTLQTRMHQVELDV